MSNSKTKAVSRKHRKSRERRKTKIKAAVAAKKK